MACGAVPAWSSPLPRARESRRLLAAAVDADGQVDVGKGDFAEFAGDPAGLDRAGLAAAMSGSGDGGLDCDGLPGQDGELGVGGGLGVEGDDGAGQVQRCQ